MPKTIQTLILICLFRARPQDLIASRNLLIQTVFATFLLFVLRNSQLIDNANIALISLVQVALLGLGLRLFLALFSKPERWLQSAIALYGCSALILVTIMPFILSSGSTDLAQGSLSLAKIMIIVSSFWYFTVIIFIFKETLEISIALAFFISLVLELAFAIILLKLFGGQLL